MSYYESLAIEMNSIQINKDMHNVVFTDGKGGYDVKKFDVEKHTFDNLCDTMVSFNKKSMGSGKRALYVTTTNRFTEGESMITFCAPNENPIVSNCGIRGKGPVGDIYLVPDTRQMAADYVNDNPESLEGITVALDGTVN